MAVRENPKKGSDPFILDTTPGSSTTDYLLREAARRNSVVLILNTTPAQEAAINAYLASHSGPVNKYPDNCAARTSGALAAGGMPDPYSFGGTDNFPSDTMAQAAFWQGQLGGQDVPIPQGSTSLPPVLNQFNPGGP